MQTPNHLPATPRIVESGQICYVHESLATPIQMIFCDTPAIQANKKFKAICDQELKELCDPKSTIGKVRPCVVMYSSSQGQGMGTTTICLKGTFGKTHPENLARVYKQFVLGVHPNQGYPETPHLHLQPEGTQPLSWVVAYEYPCSKKLYFEQPRNSSSSSRAVLGAATVRSHCLHKSSLAILRDQCRLKMVEWQARCKEEEGFAEECWKEHRVFAYTVWPESGLTYVTDEAIC